MAQIDALASVCVRPMQTRDRRERRRLSDKMGGGGVRNSLCSSSSSGEEEGDADWRAAIDSVATTNSFGPSTTNGHASTSNGSETNSIALTTEDHEVNNNTSQRLKHYQIKAQKLLDGLLEKTIEIVRDPIRDPDNGPVVNEVGIQLFKHAPAGIIFDHIDEIEGPRKRPKILPGKEINEKSKKFKWQLQSAAVDGMDIIAAARDACNKSLAELEAKDAAAKAAAKREEDRVAELKRIRGERWLPSIARNMQAKF